MSSATSSTTRSRSRLAPISTGVRCVRARTVTRRRKSPRARAKRSRITGAKSRPLKQRNAGASRLTALSLGGARGRVFDAPYHPSLKGRVARPSAEPGGVMVLQGVTASPRKRRGDILKRSVDLPAHPDPHLDGSGAGFDRNGLGLHRGG